MKVQFEKISHLVQYKLEYDDNYIPYTLNRMCDLDFRPETIYTRNHYGENLIELFFVGKQNSYMK